ncbi:MAG: hypothetical protein KJ709_03325 [Nanoarchaeota archaeon]|nr:hypothetical protein [Nanoarchaeota archaeon]
MTSDTQEVDLNAQPPQGMDELSWQIARYTYLNGEAGKPFERDPDFPDPGVQSFNIVTVLEDGRELSVELRDSSPDPHNKPSLNSFLVMNLLPVKPDQIGYRTSEFNLVGRYNGFEILGILDGKSPDSRKILLCRQDGLQQGV